MTKKHGLKRSMFLLICLMILIPTISCTTTSPQELIALAAGGAKPALDEILVAYNKNASVDIKVSYSGAGDLLQQMHYGNFGDIFIAPEQEFMDEAIENEDVDPETCVSLCYMIPVIAVSKGNPKNISSLSDLAKPGMRISITRPETTLLGRLSPEIFAKAGFLEEISDNIVAYASDPNNLMYYITSGNVDAGVTWNFYEKFSNELEIVFMMPSQLTGIGEMRAAITSHSSSEIESSNFLEFLTSEEGRAIFEKHGYITDKEEVIKFYR